MRGQGGRRIGALAVVAVAAAVAAVGPGCAKGSGVVIVNVEATGIVRNVKTLAVQVTQSGQPARPLRISLASVVDLPPPQSFGLRFDADRSGSVTVEVEALDASDQPVAPKATANGEVQPSGTSTITVTLQGGAVTDLAVADLMVAAPPDLLGVDLSGADLTAVPPDLAAPPPDLASAPDLVRVPDLVVLPDFRPPPDLTPLPPDLAIPPPATWTLQASGTTDSLGGVWGEEPYVFACGANGRILRSVNNGNNWQTITSPVATSLAAGVGSGLVHYIVGASGVILRSTDRGLTWQPQASGVSAGLTGVWQKPGLPLLVAVGDAGTIVTSTNGTTWTPTVTGFNEDLYGVWGSGPGDLNAVGFSGRTLHFDGLSWSPGATTNTADTLTGVDGDLTGGGEVFTVSANGPRIYRSLNRGATWALLQTGSPGFYLAIWGSDTGNLYVVGDTGRILRSTNHGQTWISQSSPTTNVLRHMWGSRHDNIFIVGLAGTILHGQ